MTAKLPARNADNGYDGFVVPVLVRAQPSSMGIPSDEDMSLINKFASVELKPDQVFRFRGTASTSAVDSFFTHMDEKSSMPRFVRALKSASPLQDSHDPFRLPIGASFSGEMADIPGGKVEGADAAKEVIGDWYLLRNHDVPGSGNTDSYIRGVESGIYRRMSIGFGGPDMRIVCDVDGLDLWDWESWHYPGERMEDGTVVTYTVKDADLLETSLVYKNATPGALVKRFQHLVTERKIRGDEVARLEARHGIRLTLPPYQSFAAPRSGGQTTTEEGDPMPQTEARRLILEIQSRAGKSLSAANSDKLSGFADKLNGNADAITEVATGLAAMVSGTTSDEKDDKEKKDNADMVADVRSAAIAAGIVKEDAPFTRTEVATLRRYAVAGREYRRSLVEEAVQARQAVLGQDKMTPEQADKYRARLDASDDLEFVQDERDTWTAQRSQKFQGGRPVPLPRKDEEDQDQEKGIREVAL